MIRVGCPECGEKFAVHPAMAGKPINCPKCKSTFQTGAAGRRVTTDDYTGVVEVGGRKIKGHGGGKRRKLDPKILVLGAVLLVALGLVLYFLVLS